MMQYKPSPPLLWGPILLKLDFLAGTFGVDFQKDDDNDDAEVESATSKEEEHLPQTGMASCAAAQSVDITKFFSQPSESPSTTHKSPASKIKGQSK